MENQTLIDAAGLGVVLILIGLVQALGFAFG